jgi:hypothetical protein
MSVRTKHLKLVGVGSAVALTIGALASPALAAGHDLTYTCSGTPGPLGPVAATLNPGKVPAKLTAGQSVKRAMTEVVHLDQTQTGTAQALGTSVSGTIKAKGPLAFKMIIPDTPIPATPGATMDVNAAGPGTITATKAGKFKVNAGPIDAVLNLTGGAGGPITATQNCTAPTDGTKTLGTITVAKDKTKTTEKATGGKGSVQASAKVKSHFGLKATGKVKFTLTKGAKKVSDSAKIKKGVAKASFKGLAKGKWSITAKYAGSKNLKGSSDKGSVTVK